jgi:predicted lysophospholipase L1 biosynthesis ABC-type transport system permease subunit
VAIVTESLDRILSEGGTSVGRLITESSYSPPDPPDVIEVVGVVPDAVSDVTLLQPLVIYMPGAQLNPRMSREIIVRAAGDTNAAARAVANALAQFDDAALTRPMLTIEDQLVNQLGAQRFGMHVMGGLGMIAGLLAALAVYVIAETISTGRRREMGIRAALGARGWQLSSIVLSESLRLVGLGIATGLLMAWLGSGAIRALLFGIEPMDWVTLTSVAGLTFLLALAVSLKPALAAARVDAASTLREQ